MLLNQFQEVSRIDARITKIHKELIGLYTRRDAIAETGAGQQTRIITKIKAAPIDQLRMLYDQLVRAWDVYDCKVPTYKYLKPKLARAQTIMRDLQAANPTLRSLQIVLVPPTAVLPFPLSDNWRESQTAIDADYVQADVAAHVTPDTVWRVLVADTDTQGLALGSASDILDRKSYLMAGHDARALGLREYTALTLQLGTEPAIDMNTWTLLLKGVDTDAPVPCATFAGGRFRFELDELDGALGENCFRPAVEA